MSKFKPGDYIRSPNYVFKVLDYVNQRGGARKANVYHLEVIETFVKKGHKVGIYVTWSKSVTEDICDLYNEYPIKKQFTEDLEEIINE